MAAFKTALVLVLVAASALGWENLPSIPANRRAEYFLQHDDGAYKFGYDTGEGQSAQATADAANQVKGAYSYVDGAGQRVNWQYTAGNEGFVPVMGAAQSGGSSSGAFGARTSGFGSRHSGVVPSTSAYTSGAPVAEDADFDENADASYNFNIDTDSYKRSEVADAKGNIQGQYSYNSPVGGSHAISYIAGEGTGFVVTSDASSGAQQVSGSQSSGYNYQAPQQTYRAPSKAYAGASSNGQTQVNPDGSFAFSYTTADHNHQAVADAQNNVRGSYSFKSADDGQTRKVDYVAGSNTGFVASGSHLPVAPLSSASVGPSHGSRASAFGQRSSNSYVAPSSSSSNNAQSDGSYSFSYQTDDHSHHAAADPRGNVAGSFSYTADDGVARKIDYTAGAEQGFVVKGAHLPVAPVVSAVSSHSSGSGSYQAPSGSGYQYAAPASSGYSSENDENSDGSYSYSYNTGSSAKQESADAKGNVAGTFSYLGGDGVNRKLSYTARANEGFVVQGDHLPVAPVAGSGQEVGIAVHSAFAQPNSYSGSVNTRAGSSGQGSSSGNVMASKDGAYSYSYTTGGQSQNSAAPSYKSASASQNSYNSGASKAYLAPSASSSSHGSSSGQVMASKDGAYSYSYSTGGQSGVAPSSYKSSASGQTAFGSAAVKAYSSPIASSSSHGSSAGQVMASKDGAYSYSYSTGGQSGAAPAYKSSTSGQTAFGSAAVKAYSSPVASSSSHGSSAGQVMASKDGAYSYSYSTGGQSGAAPAYKSGSQNAFSSGAVNSYSSSNSANAGSNSGSQQNDGSYSFSYDAGTHNHEQVSDPQNNVRGSYSYKSKDDGQVRKIEYSAGSETGFVVKGAHLPVAPASGAAAYIGGRPAHSPGIKAPAQRVPAHGGGYVEASQKAPSSDETGDASYSYSYKTDTSSKEESSDAQGNVVGSFSYIGGDGVNRKLSYTAKNEAGFNAAGAHLPVEPSTGSGSQFGAKSSSSAQSHQFGAQAGGYSPSATSSHAHGQQINDGKVVISKYLPPVSSEKFGYIFDTKA